MVELTEAGVQRARAQQAVGGCGRPPPPRALHQVVPAARRAAVRHRVPPHARRDAHQEAALRLAGEDLFRLRTGD